MKSGKQRDDEKKGRTRTMRKEKEKKTIKEGKQRGMKKKRNSKKTGREYGERR